MGTSKLSFGERLGHFLGSIPVVSTFASAIKAIVYYNRSKGNAIENARMNDAATKVEKVTFNQGIFNTKRETLPLAAAESRIYKQLAKASLKEMIPFYNVFVAVTEEEDLLKALNLTRKLNDPIERINVLCKKYNVDLVDIPADKKEYFGDLLIKIDNLDLMQTPSLYDQSNIHVNKLVYADKKPGDMITAVQPGALLLTNTVKQILFSRCFAKVSNSQGARPLNDLLVDELCTLLKQCQKAENDRKQLYDKFINEEKTVITTERARNRSAEHLQQQTTENNQRLLDSMKAAITNIPTSLIE